MPTNGLAYLVRNRINAIKKKYPALGLTETANELIGFRYYVDYKSYLENRFLEEYGRPFDWETFHGNYSIEHIEPLSCAGNDPAEMRRRLHYSNTCILDHKLNLSRGRTGIDYETFLECLHMGSIEVN